MHSYAGDLAKKRVGEHALIATDIIESLKEIKPPNPPKCGGICVRVRKTEKEAIYNA